MKYGITCEIVSSKERQVTEFSENMYYVYIPLGKKEAELFAPETEHPCWRIGIVNEMTN